jgi:DNA-binding transcriptional LysR family regulator
MDWGKLRSFHAAAEAGSLTSAGDRLGISQSAVSRQIAALEETLGVSLFQRHARGLVLTDAGHTLFRSTMDMAQAAQSANTALRDQQETPQGELIVSAPVAFGSTWLVPRLGGFVKKHPDLHLDLRLEDREYDLLKLEAECAIRLWAADKADLIQRKLGTVATNLYASPEYLKTAGMPRTPQDLDNHRIIAYGDESSPPAGDELCLPCRPRRRPAAPGNAEGEQCLRHVAGRRCRPRHCRRAGLYGLHHAAAGEGLAGKCRPDLRSLLYLPKRSAPFEAGCGLPRLRNS